MNRLVIFILIIFSCLLCSTKTQAQENASALFDSEEPIQMTLTFDVRQFLRKKYKMEYMPAKFQAKLEDGSVIEDEIRIRARGNSRLSYCHLPPMKLNFKTEDKKGSKFLEQTTLKLVTPCKRGETFQQYVYREYMAYKMFNLISDQSFKVRLVEINLVDSEGKRKDYQAYGFFIEHVEDVAERNESRRIEVEKFRQHLVDKRTMAKVSLFQYAIGNTDWLVQNGHNLKFIQLNDLYKQEFHIIPYDFDYAGLVNTIYAIPHDKLALESVLDRLYMGVCVGDDIIQDVLQQFKDEEENFYALIHETEGLSQKTRLHMKRYLQEFYKILANPRLVEANILSYCR